MVDLFTLRRNELNSILSGNARLCFLLPVFNTRKVMAVIEFGREPGDGTITYSDYYFLHFSGVASITIGTQQPQFFPSELQVISAPSQQLIELILRQFRGQFIFEWNCFFAHDEINLKKLAPNLYFRIESIQSNAREMVGFFSMDFNLVSCWEVWINYSELTIENHLRQSLTVEQFTESARRFLEGTEK